MATYISCVYIYIRNYILISFPVYPNQIMSCPKLQNKRYTTSNRSCMHQLDLKGFLYLNLTYFIKDKIR